MVKPVEMTHIVVADRAMQLGTRLDANNVRLIPWPGDEPVAGMFRRIEDCEGRAVISNLAENEPVLESKLACDRVWRGTAGYDSAGNAGGFRRGE